MAKYDAETEDAAEASEADRCLPSSCGGVLCVWLMYRGGAFPRARLDVPDSPEVPHCAVCLESSRHLGPLFPLCCCSAERRQPAVHHDLQLHHQRCAAGVVGVALVCKGGLLPFVVRCSARCLDSILTRGLVLCLWRAGGAPVLCAAVFCVPPASAIDSGRGGAARGLEVRGPVLQPQVGGLGSGFVVEVRAQWRTWSSTALLVLFDWFSCIVYLKGKRTGRKGA